MARGTASPAGPGTTTTTAGSTSSPPATTARSTDVVKGLLGQPHSRQSQPAIPQPGRQGLRGRDQGGRAWTWSSPRMGSNFGDFDNDGYLDFYLGTGDPSFATLVPNRMFKNVGRPRSPRSPAGRAPGHLQKGHGVACGDWDRDGDVDLFIEMGGAVNGDRVSQRPVPEPRPGEPLADGEAGGPEDQPGGHRGADQGRHGGGGAADRSPACLVGQQLRRESAAADRRPGRGRIASRCWRSTGRPAGRPRSSATSRPTRPSRSPSSPSPTGRWAGSPSLSPNRRSAPAIRLRMADGGREDRCRPRTGRRGGVHSCASPAENGQRKGNGQRKEETRPRTGDSGRLEHEADRRGPGGVAGQQPARRVPATCRVAGLGPRPRGRREQPGRHDDLRRPQAGAVLPDELEPRFPRMAAPRPRIGSGRARRPPDADRGGAGSSAAADRRRRAG